MHSYKKRYYRLDIIVGKVILLGYPQCFSIEDRIVVEMKEHYKEWERRTSLALIPFYMQRLKFMEDEHHKMNREHGLASDEDAEFLKRNIEETQRKLELEKKEIQDLADKLYRKWKDVKELRKKNQYMSTPWKLKVLKGNNGELYFNLKNEQDVSKTLVNGNALPRSEEDRRSSAKSIRAYVRLIINGHYVARSRKQQMDWPSFEIDVAEQFQVCLFTMPSSIQLEVVMGGLFREQLVDVLDIEVPGSHVKALSSAATLIKEISFSKRVFTNKRNAKKTTPAKPTIQTEEQKIEEKKKEELDERNAEENDVKGLMYVKA